MHNKCVEIAPALWLLGIGGSCPAYDKNGSMIWNGYPYLEKDIEIKEGIQALKKIPASNSVDLERRIHHRLFYLHTVLPPWHHQVMLCYLRSRWNYGQVVSP